MGFVDYTDAIGMGVRVFELTGHNTLTEPESITLAEKIKQLNTDDLDVQNAFIIDYIAGL